MLTDDGERLVVMDLGLVRAVESGGTVTQHARECLCGYSPLRSPEQITSGLTQSVDHRADIYSLGASLWKW